MLEDILKTGLAQMEIEADSAAISSCRIYYDHLTEKNKVMNLTAISGEEESARLHFLDSFAPLKFFDFDGKTVIDIGTGAGFPGLPIKLACPGINLTLLDSSNKRVEFLREVCERSGVAAKCIHARAEDCGLRREIYDFAVSRAVARLNVLCELCFPYVKVGGAFLALKGPALADELEAAKNALKTLGGELEVVYEYEIPETELSHKIAVIRKIKPTPKNYPRKFAEIKKSPL